MFLDTLLPLVLPGMLGPALAAGAQAAEAVPGPYRGVVARVIDGDTLAVRVTIWLDIDLDVLVRVRGIDAPEIRGRCDLEKSRAVEAKASLSRIVGEGEVMLREIKGDKFFGRVIADVITAKGQDVGRAMLAGGHARPYAGGARGGWCEIGRNAIGVESQVAQRRIGDDWRSDP